MVKLYVEQGQKQFIPKKKSIERDFGVRVVSMFKGNHDFVSFMEPLSSTDHRVSAATDSNFSFSEYPQAPIIFHFNGAESLTAPGRLADLLDGQKKVVANEGGTDRVVVTIEERKLDENTGRPTEDTFRFDGQDVIDALRSLDGSDRVMGFIKGDALLLYDNYGEYVEIQPAAGRWNRFQERSLGTVDSIPKS